MWKGDLMKSGILSDGENITITGYLTARNIAPPIGSTYYVKDDAAGNETGKDWTNAFTSINDALDVAPAFSDILVAPGDYDEGETVAIATEGIRLIGFGDLHRNVSMIYDGEGAGYNLVTIDAHHVEIIGMALSAAADTYNGIVISGTSASYKSRIYNCRLDGWSGETGIYLNESPDTIIERCVLRSWNTQAIYANSTRTLIKDCIFHVVAGKVGINHIPAGGSRPDNVYVDNLFSGATSSATTAIKFTGAPSDGTIICAGNRLCGTFDVDITQIAAHGGVENYAADADGGSLIDTCSG